MALYPHVLEWVDALALRGKEVMNPQQRRKVVSRQLRKLRKTLGKTREETAKLLGWDLNTYTHVELGNATISAGQAADIDELMQSLTAAATIRDKLRAGVKRRIRRL